MIYGYARVSTQEQNEDRQVYELLKCGVEQEKIYIDKQSGKDFIRRNYIRLIRRLHAGDVLIVKSIDRLGRDYDEILEQWKYLTKKKRTDIKILDMPLLDTTIYKDLTGTLIADIVLQLLSYVAESERKNILQRQREGIEAAHRRGVKFGRPQVVLPDEFEDLCYQWESRKISAREAAEIMDMNVRTFYRKAKKIVT